MTDDIVSRWTAREMAQELETHALDDCDNQVIETHLCNIAATLVRNQANTIERQRELLDHRDEFIVASGLWDKYVASLDKELGQ